MPDTIPLEELLSWIKNQQSSPRSPLEAKVQKADQRAARLLQKALFKKHGQRLHFPAEALPPLD